jgi:hypothetical protein
LIRDFGIFVQIIYWHTIIFIFWKFFARHLFIRVSVCESCLFNVRIRLAVSNTQSLLHHDGCGAMFARTRFVFVSKNMSDLMWDHVLPVVLQT